MVKLSFNLSKRDFAWIGLIVVLVGLGFGYAYGGMNPAVEGHSVGEINFAGGFNVPSGNVGIGVPHPTQKLDVNGNVKANDFYIAKTGKWASSLGGSGIVKGGLYGSCTNDAGGKIVGGVQYNCNHKTVSTPAICKIFTTPFWKVDNCACPSGFIMLRTTKYYTKTTNGITTFPTPLNKFRCLKN